MAVFDLPLVYFVCAAVRAKKLSSLALPPSLTGPKYELGLSKNITVNSVS